MDADERSSEASGALITPTFFINGRRYDGPWDESALADAMLGTLGHRVRSAALDFASWGPSAGVLLLLATLVAVVLTNTGLGPGFAAFWDKIRVHARRPRLCAVFTALDQRRAAHRLLSGHRPRDQARIHGRPPHGWRSAALPVAGAIGGTVAPAALYLLVVPARTLVAWLGRADVDRHRLRGGADRHVGIASPGRTAHLPHCCGDRRRSLRDRCGRGVLFGRAEPRLSSGAAVLIGALALLNRSHVYALTPYIVVGLALWACVLASGLHPTLAGVILALFIPTRPPPDLTA